MRRRINFVLILAMALVISTLNLPVFAAEGSSGNNLPDSPKVEFETSLGNIVVQLDSKKAPLTVENFLKYVKAGQYDGVIFHRVINGFMIQGGGFTQDMREKPTLAPIQNEADNGLHNKKYTIAMARTPDPHSASAQFFINTKDNDFLDFRDRTPRGWGYAVFGEVIKGQDVVDRIEKVATGRKNGMDDVPLAPVVINKAVIL